MNLIVSTIKNLKRRKLRAVLPLIGIILGVVLMFVVQQTAATAAQSINLYTQGVYGKASIVVDAATTGLKTQALTTMRDSKGVRSVAPILNQNVTIKTSQDSARATIIDAIMLFNL